MSVKMTALFSNADEADFALMRLRGAGVVTESTRIIPSQSQRREEKGVFRSVPVATNVAGVTGMGGTVGGGPVGAFGLAGTGVPSAAGYIFHNSTGSEQGYVEREVMLEITVRNEDARTCEALLYSSHGREVKSV